MLETLLVALATFFATVGPFDIAVIFAVLTGGASLEQKRQYALRGIMIGTSILLVFALVGDFLLESLGISLAALKTAGGILLLLLAIEMVFSPNTGGIPGQKTLTEQDGHRDVSVFPLATPLIAGPGTMGAVVLLMAQQQGQIMGQLTVLFALVSILLLTYLNLRIAGRIQRYLGTTGTHVITRIMGVLLTALAVQFIFDGVGESGLL